MTDTMTRWTAGIAAVLFAAASWSLFAYLITRPTWASWTRPLEPLLWFGAVGGIVALVLWAVRSSRR